MLTSPSPRATVETFHHYYPFGSHRVRDVVKDYSCGFGDDDIGVMCSIKVLFLGCGDLMKTLVASTAENVQQFEIHLNDQNPSILARNIMMLKMISARDFDPEKDEDFNALWDIWYNATWPETTRKRFWGVLKDLVNGKLPQNVIIPDSSHLQSVKKVWSSWRKTLTESRSESTILIQKMSLERILKIWTAWGEMFPEEFAQELELKNGDSIDAAVHELGEEVESHIGIENLTDCERENIRYEIEFYFESGSCRDKNVICEVCVNPTLLDPTNLSWQVFHRLSPFDSYFPLVKKELSSSRSWKLIRSCQKILKSLVYSYRTRIQDIKIFFHLKDPLEFCYSYPSKFDIIDCSNLPDQLGLVNIINACSERLAENHQAMLFTETLNWTNLSSSVEEYLEKALCTSLSMIPTIYGLRLVDRVELGASAFVNLRCKTALPVHLCWQKVPSFQNVTLDSSPEINRFLDQLADKCFDILFPRKLDGSHEGDGCGMLCYTPLTFDYVVNSMINRVGGDRWLNEERKCQGWTSNLFVLARRTAKAWRRGQPILNLTAKMQVCQDHVLNESSMLRLVLFPCATFPEANSKGKIDVSGPGIHMIDNMKIETKKVPDGSEIIFVSFLLPADHGLENTHLAFLLDLEDGTISYVFKSLRSMRPVNFCQPYPFPSKRLEQHPSDASSQFQMVIFSCTESLNDYQLKISIPCGDTVSSVNVSTNQKMPCQSFHEITITPDQPNNIKPLTLSFPYPFDQIHLTHHQEARLINLVLKKALLEPWPQDFQLDKIKWNADQLMPWEEKKARIQREDRLAGIPSLSSSCLAVHVASQFNLHKLPKPSKIEKSDLNAVRHIIKFLFLKFAGENPSGMSFVRILLDGSPEEHPDWYLKVHHPIRTSPQGSPMLLVSAFDNKFEGKKIEVKNNELVVKNDFIRVFPTWNLEETLTIKVDAVELLKLLRCVLRINSTKIEPSNWQKDNLRFDENSPWLATFISPLYLDAPLYKKEVKPNIIFTLIKMVTILFFIIALLSGVGYLFWLFLSYLFWYILSFF